MKDSFFYIDFKIIETHQMLMSGGYFPASKDALRSAFTYCFLRNTILSCLESNEKRKEQGKILRVKVKIFFELYFSLVESLFMN